MQLKPSNVVELNRFRDYTRQVNRAGGQDRQFADQVSKFDRALARHRIKLKRQRIRLSDPKGNILVLEALLNMTVGLIGTAEQQFFKYKNERSAYCINALTNQVRELMVDIRQLRTGKKQLQHIVNQIVLPNLSLLLQHQLTDYQALRKEISRLPDGRARRRALENINNNMQQNGLLFNQISGKLQAALAEYLVS